MADRNKGTYYGDVSGNSSSRRANPFVIAIVVVIAFLVFFKLLGGGNSDSVSTDNPGAYTGAYSMEESAYGQASYTSPPVTDPPPVTMEDITCWSPGMYSQYAEGYVMSWRSGYGTGIFRNYSKYRRLTGTLNPPTISGLSPIDYFASDHLPTALSPEYRVVSTKTTAQIRSAMYETTRRELPRIVSEQNLYVLQIYGDDRLLYTSPSMYTRTTPVHFSVDVTGVHMVEFRWYHPVIHYGADDYGRMKLVLTDIVAYPVN